MHSLKQISWFYEYIQKRDMLFSLSIYITGFGL